MCSIKFILGFLNKLEDKFKDLKQIFNQRNIMKHFSNAKKVILQTFYIYTFH